MRRKGNTLELMTDFLAFSMGPIRARDDTPVLVQINGEWVPACAVLGAKTDFDSKETVVKLIPLSERTAFYRDALSASKDYILTKYVGTPDEELARQQIAAIDAKLATLNE